jgi:hypothetical protein
MQHTERDSHRFPLIPLDEFAKCFPVIFFTTPD